MVQAKSNLGTSLLILAILAVGIAAVNSYYTLNKYSEIGDALTGYTGSEGFVNVTVASVVSVNFSTDGIVWGAGSIDTGENNASLKVEDASVSVTRGNWSTSGISPLSIENIGSVNVSLRISGDKNETDLFGEDSSVGHRAYKLNFTDSDAASCVNTTSLSLRFDVNKTGTGTQICSHLGFLDTQDQLNISVLLAVPYDGNTGPLESVLTATAATAG